MDDMGEKKHDIALCGFVGPQKCWYSHPWATASLKVFAPPPPLDHNIF